MSISKVSENCYYLDQYTNVEKTLWLLTSQQYLPTWYFILNSADICFHFHLHFFTTKSFQCVNSTCDTLQKNPCQVICCTLKVPKVTQVNPFCRERGTLLSKRTWPVVEIRLTFDFLSVMRQEQVSHILDENDSTEPCFTSPR